MSLNRTDIARYKAKGEQIVDLTLPLFNKYHADRSQGASEYFQRTENIAGVKVGICYTLIFLNPTDWCRICAFKH